MYVLNHWNDVFLNHFVVQEKVMLQLIYPSIHLTEYLPSAYATRSSTETETKPSN